MNAIDMINSAVAYFAAAAVLAGPHAACATLAAQVQARPHDYAARDSSAADGKRVLCKRIKRQRVWNNKSGEGEVSINNGVLQVYVNHYTYTRKL